MNFPPCAMVDNHNFGSFLLRKRTGFAAAPNHRSKGKSLRLANCEQGKQVEEAERVNLNYWSENPDCFHLPIKFIGEYSRKCKDKIPQGQL
jgi:hypothetical protein